jgi:hypothetical protein
MDERIENILHKDGRRIADAAAQQDIKRERAGQSSRAAPGRTRRGPQCVRIL